MFSLQHHKTLQKDVKDAESRTQDIDLLPCTLCQSKYREVYVPTCKRVDHGVCRRCFKLTRTKCVHKACRGVFKRVAALEFLRTLQ
jgi:hypothetical protein